VVRLLDTLRLLGRAIRRKHQPQHLVLERLFRAVFPDAVVVGAAHAVILEHLEREPPVDLI
jgi:hypothetical protein